MFRTLGNWANHHWLLILVLWGVAAGGLWVVAPSWEAVAKDGDFDYLPDSVTSRRAQKLLADAFPADEAKSQIVLIFAREDAPLTNDDRQFAFESADKLKHIKDLPLVGNVLTERTPVIGKMLLSHNKAGDKGGAVMVMARLSTDMMAVKNVYLLHYVTPLLKELQDNAPAGLKVGLSGAAMIGGDIQDSVRESVQNTEFMTIGMVILCLVLIYQAPLLVIVPLLTIGVSLLTANSLVALIALHFGPDQVSWGGLQIFTTTKIFVVVILFGAGTDFCLFLIARFKEELSLGRPLSEASGDALANVGHALAASAFTTIMGLGMMVFADYGKFVYSGPVIAICLFIALMACLTFAPAVLRALGTLVFWPFGVKPVTNLDDETQIRGGKLWGRIADWVLAYPGWILFGSLWMSSIFLYFGLFEDRVSHDLMGELAPNRATVIGTAMISKHYSEGEIAPTLVVAKTNFDLNSDENEYALAYLHKYLTDIPGVTDVRSQYEPVGKHTGGTAAGAAIANSPDALARYVSDKGEYSGKVTQLQVLLVGDPFARDTRKIIDLMEAKLAAVTSGTVTSDTSVDEVTRDGLAAWKGTEFVLGGTTPAIRDLQIVTESDQTRIQILVTAAVFVVILVLLRDFWVCVYLIITVLLSYFVTIGMTVLAFKWYYGASFDGLDWKVPIFLFVILIAVGQDYNIYLTTRVFEEQRKYGKSAGLRHAMIQTGGIITSCGIIMAGTFISMCAGTLRAMIELGFSLSLGVLLDTFFVRTIVVPCFFALMARRYERKHKPHVAAGEVAGKGTKTTKPPKGNKAPAQRGA